MDKNDENKMIGERKKQWQEKTVKPALARFKMTENPTRFYTPADIPDFDFLNDVGFPGEYPYTAGTYAVEQRAPSRAGGAGPRGASSTSPIIRSVGYSGYGTAEDTRDYYRDLQKRGGRAGPNLAFDLPTQIGYDSDSPSAKGDVGKTGVIIDTLRDMEIVYEAFTGDLDLDRIASNWTINAPSNIILAMYLAVADKRGVPIEKLTATPQNDILKEFIARSTYIFPPRPSMRMIRDSLVFLVKHCPKINVVNWGGYHISGAGATREQTVAFAMSNAIAYLNEGIRAGLNIDDLAPQFPLESWGGGMNFFKEIALLRASRRMWAKLLKERFGAKSERSWILRGGHGGMGAENCTVQRPLNNIARAVSGGISNALGGYGAGAGPPFDEPLGLGWSLEASQLSADAGRILTYEAKLAEVRDPLAGSYYVERLTDEFEETVWKEIEKIDAMGGAVTAIETGYMQRQIAKSAYERQRRIESGEDLVVGVNCFTGEGELEVTTSRLVPHPYDATKREQAEAKQIKSLTELKSSRDGTTVKRLLAELRTKAKDENENLIPCFVECAKAYVSLQEMVDVLRGVFGEWKPVALW